MSYIGYTIQKGGLEMYENCGCGYGRGQGMRGFLTKEEKIEMLKEYKESLEQEAKGVAERIKDLERGK